MKARNRRLLDEQKKATPDFDGRQQNGRQQNVDKNSRTQRV